LHSLIVYLFLILLSKSIDKENNDPLLTIEKRTGIDLSALKMILGRFV